jgi:hypothetical protein
LDDFRSLLQVQQQTGRAVQVGLAIRTPLSMISSIEEDKKPPDVL